MHGRKLYPKLERQPLTLVLAEFRFDPLSDLSVCMPGFAGHLGLTNHSFQETSSQEVHVGADEISIKKKSHWSWFASEAEKGLMIQVENDRLIIVTTRYPRFDAFAKQCLHYVQALKQVMNPDRLLRVGLRYNDAVVPLEGEELSLYLIEKLLPVDTRVVVEHHRMETLVRTNAGLLAMRSLIGRHGLAVMPDIGYRFPLTLPVDVPLERTTAVLDFDHFWKPDKQDGVDFGLEEIQDRLCSLHEAAREAFWQLTTDFARRERWA